MPRYDERELTAPVSLCDANGRLNPGAVGWSRRPLHRCNLTGRWPRKKKWNFWLISSDSFAFCVALANVDYLGLAFGFLLDYETGELTEETVPLPLGSGCRLGERVEDPARFSNRRMELHFERSASGVALRAACRSFGGKPLSADLSIEVPEGHETLNAVIPWSERLFQFTSKQNSLPATGTVRLGSRAYECRPDSAFAHLDFGRGVWPYRTKWNWAAGTAWQNGALIGLQFGGQWTDGTGMNENGVCVNGRLHKIHEDMVFQYDRKNILAPWRIRTSVTRQADLVLTPFREKITRINLGVLKSEVHQVFGRFAGTIEAEGKTFRIDDLIGWSEDHDGRW